MDMSYIDTLARFGHILTEADEAQVKKETESKESDLERARRIIEERLCDYYSFPGFTLDGSMRTAPGARLDGNTEPPPEGYRLTEFIRLYITGLLMHPPTEGGWGIGDSRPAIANLKRIQQSKNDPTLRGIGSSGDELTPDSLKNPDTYPEALRSYIATLSAKYMLGIMRIGMDECGLLAYTLYKKREITDSILQSGNSLKDVDMLKSIVPSDWDFDKLYHLSHIIIPQFILRLLIAPSTPTPNCNPALIAQNEVYLGDDLKIIQSYVTPIENLPEINANLQVKGSAEPATYNDMARYAGAWNFSLHDIKDKASHDSNGAANVYNPPDDTKLPDELTSAVDDNKSLRPRYTTPANDDGTHQETDSNGTIRREYPSQRFGNWYVVDVDNDTAHKGGNHDLLARGYTVLEDDNGNPYKFWFIGGKTKTGKKNNGVYPWCWTWGHYDRYRSLTGGDRGYMLLNQRIVDSDILSYPPSRDSSNNGNPYDSSAFGVVVCGPNGDGIPGLIKPTCFQGRNDTTDGCTPGSQDAPHYDDSLVPNGGNIPGIIPYGRWQDGNGKTNTARAINNSIFCLALIGKWDGSIKVTNGKDTDSSQIEMYPERLIPLMQRWFPVELSATPQLTHESKTLKMLALSDMSTLGKILGEHTSDADAKVKEMLLTVFRTDDGKTWHLLHAEKGHEGILGYILVPADDEFKLRSLSSKGSISDEEYEEQLENLPALMFTVNDDGRYIPFLAKELTVHEARELLEMWGSNRERSLEERIGGGNVTPRPRTSDDSSDDAPEDTQDSIKWCPTMNSSGKNRTVGVTDDGGIWLSGPETGGEPLMVSTDTGVAALIEYAALRGTYVVTQNGDYNIWFTSTGSSDGSSTMYIVFVRKNKCKLFKMVGSVLGDTTNAILVNGDELVVIGNLMGDIARLNRQNADRYSLFVDFSDVDDEGHGPVIDGAGLYKDTLEDLGSRYPGNVGLGVSNGRVTVTQHGDPVVGTIDWYNAITMDFVETSSITLSMITKSPGKLPRETTI